MPSKKKLTASIVLLVTAVYATYHWKSGDASPEGSPSMDAEAS